MNIKKVVLSCIAVLLFVSGGAFLTEEVSGQSDLIQILNNRNQT
ncbi:hypothetical protein [Bacillus atrophaeus]|nr:hypothetical protein [Bacillus atrophaeus]